MAYGAPPTARAAPGEATAHAYLLLRASRAGGQWAQGAAGLRMGGRELPAAAGSPPPVHAFRLLLELGRPALNQIGAVGCDRDGAPSETDSPR